MYNTSLSEETREKLGQKRISYGSFISGHTSGAFCAAVFLSVAYSDIYGRSKWSKIIWITSLASAATTGFLRYDAGRHYPTDVIAGAIAGGLIGYAIPYLHKKQSKNINLFIASNLIYLSYDF